MSIKMLENESILGGGFLTGGEISDRDQIRVRCDGVRVWKQGHGEGRNSTVETFWSF